jgi:hypothetical protein
MNELETKIDMLFSAEERAQQVTVDSVDRVEFEQALLKLKTPEIERVMVQGASAFRAQVANRILKEHGDEVFLNRCYECDRILRTPQAKQCFWCGHSWHKVMSHL